MPGNNVQKWPRRYDSMENSAFNSSSSVFLDIYEVQDAYPSGCELFSCSHYLARQCSTARRCHSQQPQSVVAQMLIAILRVTRVHRSVFGKPSSCSFAPFTVLPAFYCYGCWRHFGYSWPQKNKVGNPRNNKKASDQHWRVGFATNEYIETATCTTLATHYGSFGTREK